MMASESKVQAIRERIFADLGLYQEVSGLFDGAWGAGADGRRVAVHSPIDGSRLADVAVASEADFDRLVERAWASFREWSAIPSPKRGESYGQSAVACAGTWTALGCLLRSRWGRRR